MKCQVFKIGRLMVSSCFLVLFMNCNSHNNSCYMKSNDDSNKENLNEEIIDKNKIVNRKNEKCKSTDFGNEKELRFFSSLTEINGSAEGIKNSTKENEKKFKYLTNDEESLVEAKDVIENYEFFNDIFSGYI